jgi:hypothetical protein
MGMNYAAYEIKPLPDARPLSQRHAKRVKKISYSQSEAAAIMGIPRNYVRLLLDAGRLQAQPTKQARKVYYDPTQWDAARDSWRVTLRDWKQLRKPAGSSR